MESTLTFDNNIKCSWCLSDLILCSDLVGSAIFGRCVLDGQFGEALSDLDGDGSSGMYLLIVMVPAYVRFWYALNVDGQQ